MIYQGETLIERARTPVFAACRALLARGITGKLAVYSRGAAEPRLRVDIEQGALLKVEEGERVSLRLAPFREFSLDEQEEREAA